MRWRLLWLFCTVLLIEQDCCAKSRESVSSENRIMEKVTSMAQTSSSSTSTSSSASNALSDAIEAVRHWRSLNDPSALKEKRTVLLVLAALVVLLYWIVLTQFALPASKSANIELRRTELDAKMSDFEKLVYHNQMKKKEKIASDLN